MHNRPGNIGVTGGFRSRSTVGDLAAGGGPALDGQERRCYVVPAGVPLDTAANNRVLRLEYQSVFGLKAVVDRRRSREEFAHQVEHAITNTGYVDTNVLNAKSLAELFDLSGLIGE